MRIMSRTPTRAKVICAKWWNLQEKNNFKESSKQHKYPSLSCLRDFLFVFGCKCMLIHRTLGGDNEYAKIYDHTYIKKSA